MIKGFINLSIFDNFRVGIVCVYINNGNTSTAINGMASTGKDNLEDVKLFINNTVDVRKTNYS